MGSLVVIILISVAIIGVAAYFGQQRVNRLISEGKMIKRDGEFWNFAEIFTISSVDYDRVLAEINNTDFSEFKVTMYPNNGGNKQVVFKSSYEWNAEILFLDESNGKYRYRFDFTAWNTHRGLPLRSDTMNMMETKVEKMFLKLDPQAKVDTEEMKLKTKTRLF
jgi:hypothetical protein